MASIDPISTQTDLMINSSPDVVAVVQSSDAAGSVRPPERRRGRATSISAARELAIAAAFIGVSVMLRGGALQDMFQINPDEAELLAQAQAAMRSPVPFTTWATTTTGPYAVLSLALVGVLGLPMTIPFAHLLAAVLVGVLGYLGFTLARRWLPPAGSAVITVFWWLPIVLTLTGLVTDFAPFATELLPCALILAAGLIRTEHLARRPVLYLVAGLLCGVSIGAKYQAAPLALALLMVQLILAGNYRWRALLRDAVLWGVGVLLPFLVLGLAMIVSPNVSTTAIQQNLNFLSQYGAGLTLSVRLTSWLDLVTRPHVVILLLVVCWLGLRSTARVGICRLILVGGGLAAVLAGGMGFGHYLFFVYTAIVLAIGLPLKPNARLVPYIRHQLVAAGIIVVILVPAWLLSFGTSRGTANLAGRHDLSIALSKDSVLREAGVVQVCPVGAQVLVWGWASEMYVNYGWVNAIPFINVTQLTASPKNYSSGYELTRRAVEDPATTCVIDAVGPPFFHLGEDTSLTTVYPQMGELLDRKYRKAAGAAQCEICVVYVRR